MSRALIFIRGSIAIYNKKTQTPFERGLEAANRRIANVRSALDDIQSNLLCKNMEGAFSAAFEAADYSEKLTNICRELPAFTGHPKAREMIEDATLNSFPVEIGFTAEGWFSLRIPILLPKKSKGSPAYLTDPLYPAMKRFWRGKRPVRYPDNVLIFRHVYSHERPERRFRDHDNIELNRVADIIALYVMVDDSPLRCRHYYCSASGGNERTEAYVVPRIEFQNWLLREDSIPDKGVKLYENLPKN